MTTNSVYRMRANSKTAPSKTGPISFNGHRQNCTCNDCRHERVGLRIQDGHLLYEVLPTLPKQRAPEWATWIAGRAPEWKQHTNLGHAKNAIHSSGHGVLYRYMLDGTSLDWHPVAIVEPGTGKTHPALQPKVVPIIPVAVHTIQEQP